MLLKSDSRGSIESLPLTLIIISIIIAITIPLVWTGLSNYSKIQTENNIKAEIEHIATTAKQVYAGANGTSLKIDVNFAGGFFSSVEYVKIGDNVSDTRSSTIRYKLSGESEKTYVIQNPNIPLTSTKNQVLELGSGRYTLILERIVLGDINGNGFIDNNEDYIVVKIG